MCSIWREVLKLDRVGVSDNFFELGGHSLLVFRMLHRSQAQFQIKLSAHDVLGAPSIAAMALAIEDRLITELEMMETQAINEVA